MSLLAFWQAPIDEDVDTVVLFRSTVATTRGAQIASVRARDGYDNWVTHYEDEDAPTAAYYQADYIKDGLVVESSPSKAGVTPYTVTPQMVLDNIQGLPMNRVSAEFVQRMIRHAVELVEVEIRMAISPQTVTQEVYPSSVFNKIVGAGVGYNIQLKHFPVISVDNIYYQVRGAASGSGVQELENLDILIMDGAGLDGYNRGRITVYPRQTTITSIFTGLALTNYPRMAVNVLISYKHGFSSFPRAIEQFVLEGAASTTMEVAGEAETAGLSSRSVDGYSESYTASATTTIFSARRIWHETHMKQIKKLYRKPIWG